jgi:TonB family protein
MTRSHAQRVKPYTLTTVSKNAPGSAIRWLAVPSRKCPAIGPQNGFLRPSGRPAARLAASGARGWAVAAALVAALVSWPGQAAGQAPAPEGRADSVAIVGAPGAPPAPSAAALVVRGIEHYEHRKMIEGVQELERAVALRPDWATARSALAAALLRGGLFDRARAEFEALLGVDAAHGLASGTLKARDLAAPVDADAVLGLAVVHRQMGKLREADRLYRCAADLWGPSSKESARAYYLLSEMLSEERVPWGDPEAEKAKALALDPDVAGSGLLPSFADPTTDPELEPYTWPVAAARRDSLVPAGALPLLAEWPTPQLVAASEFQGTVTVEALVTRDGRVTEAAVTAPAGIAQELKDAAVKAVSSALFEPATVGGVAAEAWITIAVPARALYGA